ncbi:MAG: triple tyrosine motif-containing protein, partial [Chitinophagales bacterium]
MDGSDAFVQVHFQYNDFYLEPTHIFILPDSTWLLNTESGTFYYNPINDKIEIYPIKRFYSFSADTLYILPPLRGFYQVRDMLIDTIGNKPVYVFATFGWGIGIYDIREDIFFDLTYSITDSSLQNNMVRVLFRDKDKNYWVGTADGLYKWKISMPFRNVFNMYRQNNADRYSISGNIISGMYEDKSGILWITTNYGLNAFDGEKFTHYTPAFTSSINMYRMYADSEENLWIAVQDGFEVFNIQTKTFSHIDILDKSWVLKYPAQILTKADGTWLYGAGNNLISFKPADYHFESDFPLLYLTGFSVFDEQLFETEAFDNLKFKHNNNFITITFSCLQLSQPSTVQYQYILEGLNENWVFAGKEGKLVFTSLPPGEYTLSAKVTNPLGEWSEAKELIAFTITPP